MFNTEISVFKNIYSEPQTINLRSWILACKQGSRFIKQVMEYRKTKNEELKKMLPLVTVGAVCSNGRKLEDVQTRTGWIALDIDAKDNQHLPNAEIIRDEISKIKNVAFAGLSTSGKGVWALVKVSNPNRQAEHFEMLIKDFDSFGIKLDTTKGKNPNDARFYSYDPDAIIKGEEILYTKLPPINITNTSKSTTPNNKGRYVSKVFESEITALRNAKNGSRNETLFKCAATLSGFVASGALNETDVRQSIEQSALSIGLKHSEITSTLNSGFKAGLKSPRVIPPPN